MTWTPIKASKKADRTRNKIREVVSSVLAGCSDKTGLLDLSLGDPTAYGLTECPAAVSEEIAKAVASGKHNGYSGAAGTPAARAAIAATAARPTTADNVFVCSGASGALEMALSVLLDEGDNVLVPSPGFPLYETIAESLGAEVRSYPLRSDDDWEPDTAAMERLVDSRTRTIVINTPSNPCGALHSKKSLEAIVAIAEKHRLPIVSDEIYAGLVFDKFKSQFFSAADVGVGRCPVIEVNGLAKTFACPGWRVGWLVVHDSVGAMTGVKAGLEKLATLILGASTLCQAVVPVALQPPTEAAKAALERTRQAYADGLEKNANIIADAINGAGKHLSCCTPKGAMYVMVKLGATLDPDFQNGTTFSAKLLAEEKVFCLPGPCFDARDHVRLVTCASSDVTEKAVAKILAFADRHALPSPPATNAFNKDGTPKSASK